MLHLIRYLVVDNSLSLYDCDPLSVHGTDSYDQSQYNYRYLLHERLDIQSFSLFPNVTHDPQSHDEFVT